MSSVDQDATNQIVEALRAEPGAVSGFSPLTNLMQNPNFTPYISLNSLKAAEGTTDTPRRYAFPKMSLVSTEVRFESAQQLQREARDAGLTCDIIGSSMNGPSKEFGTWHLNFYGRKTMQALSAAGVEQAKEILTGKARTVTES